MESWNRKQTFELAWAGSSEDERWSKRTALIVIVGVNLVAWAGIAKLVALLVG